jgi:hypothetical protein
VQASVNFLQERCRTERDRLGAESNQMKAMPAEVAGKRAKSPLFANKLSRSSFGRGGLCTGLHRVVIHNLLMHEIHRVDNQRLLLWQRLRTFGDLVIN